MSAEVLPAALLSRKAVVYVRQSTQTQVQTNLESKRRQYDLVEAARRHGFATVEVIDDDLGRSASGSIARPGFDRLVATVCAGEVGAVLCLDASRLARDGRDWHHLLELCGLVGARVIDTDGIYDPCRPNDRLLLGMKGSISEFELGVIRSRMHDAKHVKLFAVTFASACRSATSGTERWGSVLILACGCRRRSVLCSCAFDSSAAPGRYCCRSHLSRCISLAPLTARSS
jgi:hypothetical protein